MDNTCRKCQHTSATDKLHGKCFECDSEQELDAATACDHWKDETKESPGRKTYLADISGTIHSFFAYSDNQAKTQIHGIALEEYQQDYDTVLYLAETYKSGKRRVLIDYEDEEETETEPDKTTLHIIAHFWRCVEPTIYVYTDEAEADRKHKEIMEDENNSLDGEQGEDCITYQKIQITLPAIDALIFHQVQAMQEEIEGLEDERDERTGALLAIRNEIDELQLDG